MLETRIWLGRLHELYQSLRSLGSSKVHWVLMWVNVSSGVFLASVPSTSSLTLPLSSVTMIADSAIRVHCVHLGKRFLCKVHMPGQRVGTADIQYKSYFCASFLMDVWVFKICSTYCLIRHNNPPSPMLEFNHHHQKNLILAQQQTPLCGFSGVKQDFLVWRRTVVECTANMQRTSRWTTEYKMSNSLQSWCAPISTHAGQLQWSPS